MTTRAAAAPVSFAGIAGSGSKPPSVLFVDDEPFILGAFGRILRSEGCEVHGVSDGHEALRALGCADYDVVVTDIVMPGLDGIGLLKRIREQDMDIPVIMLTGSPALESAMKAVEYGALQYLTKPLDPAALWSAVQRGARIRRLARVHRAAAATLGHGTQPSDRAGTEAHFDQALASLWMVFQPVMRFSTSTVFGYEALVRCGEVAFPTPDALLGAAEQLGRLQDLGRAIRSAIARALPMAPPAAQILVNLHPEDLADPQLASKNSPLAPWANRIIFEITERASLDGIANVRRIVDGLRHQGYRIAVDDLGNGYAGLGSFVALEPEIVKLDMLFVRNVSIDPIKQHLVESLVRMCAELGVETVAEGVETAGDRDTLVRLGCDLLQGYYYAKPAPEFADPQIR